jgi:hypothetical protein
MVDVFEHSFTFWRRVSWICGKLSNFGMFLVNKKILDPSSLDYHLDREMFSRILQTSCRDGAANGIS